MKHVKQSFTLVEILVVIVIIGILSSFIFFTINDSVEKASIAKSKMFSESIRNNLLLNLVSEWKFDGTTTAGSQAQSNDLKDTWGNHTPNLINGGAYYKIEAENDCISGKCLLAETTNVKDIHYGSINNIGDSSFTWEFWGKTTDSSANRYVLKKSASNWEGSFFFPYHWNSYKRALFIPSGGIYRYSNSYIDDGNWHYIIGVCDRTKNAPPDIYVDGKIDNGGYSGSCIDLPTIVSGGDMILAANFIGNLDEIKMYDTVLPESQIKQNYLLGLNNLYAKGLITELEYNKRLSYE
jgi:prepilin-type N-terminal cleavage/methylation domain-containing protein